MCLAGIQTVGTLHQALLWLCGLGELQQRSQRLVWEELTILKMFSCSYQFGPQMELAWLGG